ncbi:FAD-dependent oxidoreductase [Brevibacillus ginsengisoli]|uniref:FAD-dependent oxidoreductase n=1 Tax=Brevibacillus ginsengisoli TaxID=363854 RepID=UPI003CF65616
MRSLLGQKIMNAVSIAREAHERDVPVDQVIQERMEKSISRRAFLKGTAMVAAATASTSMFWNLGAAVAKADSEFSNKNKIVVVGAGLAGLTVAYRLKQKGIIADVYEAAKRVGGRCYTRRDDFADGQIAEHGGELIDTEHTQIRNLAAELGLKLDDTYKGEQNGTEDMCYINQAPYTFQEMTEDFKQIWPIIQKDATDAGDVTYQNYTKRAWELDQMSIADWIKKNVPGGLQSRMGQLLNLSFTADGAAEIEEQSALYLIFTLASCPSADEFSVTGSSDERYHVRGGNDQIATRMADLLSGQIQTEHELVAIKRETDGTYLLTFQNKSITKEVKADQVVLALPFSILRSSVDFNRAGFSKLKVKAIREMGFGACSKLNVQFKDRYWRKQGQTGAVLEVDFQTSWEVTRSQNGKPGILVNYTGGEYAKTFGESTTEQLTQRFLGQLEPNMPGAKEKWNGIATVDNWYGYKWTKGSFSYYGVGQYTSFYGVQAEQEGNCFFVGEHTALKYYGFLNGAVESAERAVQQILASQKAVANY